MGIIEELMQNEMKLLGKIILLFLKIIVELFLLNPQCAEAYNERANLGYKGKQAEILDYLIAISVDPNISSSHINLGNRLRYLGYDQEAVEYFTNAIRIGVQGKWIYYGRGTSRLTIKDFEGARQDFERALARDPQHLDSHLKRAETKIEQKLYQEAIQDYDFILEKLKPNFSLALLGRGKAKSLLQDFEGAMKDYQLALKHDRYFKRKIYFQMALTQLLQKKLPEALQYINKALQLIPRKKLYDKFYASDASLYYQTLSKIHFEKGAFSEAMKSIQFALKLDQENFENYLQRGKLHEQLKNYTAAIQDYQTVLEFEPSSAAAYYALSFSCFLQSEERKALQYFEKALHFQLDIKKQNAFCSLLWENILSKKAQKQWQEAFDTLQYFKKYAPLEHPQKKSKKRFRNPRTNFKKYVA